MTGQRLNQKEKELIAVAAAISAGCQKCANYHFKQAFEKGATKEEVEKAVRAATCVIGSSGEIMQRKAFELMEIEREDVPENCTDAEDRLTTLIKVAAAVASNNTNNIERYLALATSLGATHGEMTVAAKMAKAILNKAGEFADDVVREGLKGE